MFHKFPALQVRAYRNIVLGVLISGTGTEMTRVAIAWQLFQLTKSEYYLGLLGLANFLPILIGTQLAGVISDRMQRRTVLLLSNAILAVTMSALVLCELFGFVHPYVLLIFATLIAFANSFVSVSQTSIFPSLLPKHLLTNAITINSVVLSFRKIVGPALGGITIAIFPIYFVYVLDTATFLILTYIAFVTPNIVVENSKHMPLIKSYVEGVSFVLNQRLILTTGLMDFFIMLFASAQTLLPAMIEKVYHGNTLMLGLLYSSIALGSLVPGIYLSMKKRLYSMRVTLVTAVFVVSIATIAYGLTTNYLVAFIALFIFGIADEVSSIIRNNIRQLLCPEHMRARMTSVLSLLYIGGPRLGDYEAGLTASLWGLRPSLAINGVFAFITAIGFQVYYQKIKKDFADVEKMQ